MRYLSRHLNRLGLKSFLGLLLMGFTLTLASAQHEHGAPEIVYTFTGDALEGPEQLEAGFHTITLQNDGEITADIDIVRLRQGVTTEDVLSTFKEADRIAVEEGDFAAAIELSRKKRSPMSFATPAPAAVGCGSRYATVCSRLTSVTTAPDCLKGSVPE